jgi:tetratricopeptide (TPR) repeat protein
MRKCFQQAVSMPQWCGMAIIGRHGRAAAAIFGLGMLSLVWSPMIARGEETIDASVSEGSVLVATRESTESAAAAPSSNSDDDITPIEGEALEPTSQSSDHTPELAGDKSANDDSQFGTALAKAQPAQTSSKSADPADNANDNPAAASLPFQPVKFQGITVGKSTKDQLTETWGEPAETMETDEGGVLVYAIEPFQGVEVLVSEAGVVTAIKVTLATALDPKQLAKQLSLEEIDPVTVDDSEGQPLGQAFPERGVLFMFDDTLADALVDEGTRSPSVSQVAIQPLDSRAFALRAENRLHGPYEKNISDLQTAIALDPNYGHSHWLLSEVYLATGQADSADAEAAAACDIEPRNAAYQLRRGQTLAVLGEYDEAVHRIRAVLDRKDLTPIVHAQGLYEMARLASLGDVQIASKAIPFHTRAIELADSIATGSDRKERCAAKQLMVEAHMSVAEEIARQAFNQKVESISLWIGRASGLAEEYIEYDGGSVELRLLVAQRALAALASFKPTLDPSPWVAEAEEAAGTLLAHHDDELWQQRIKWELGIAYHNAMRVEHSRRQTIAALGYGQKAIEHLAQGAVSRQAVHSSEQLVGHLYFHMGAVHAVHQQDHAKAVQWYDKATPLLNGPRPVSELYAPRREGEMLVSIGVTYWQLGQQSRALEVTQSGANLIELAVEDGILAKSALAVPYSNLATMYQQMGENTNAAKYTELAKSVSPPAKKQAARVSRAVAGRRLPRVTIQAAGEEERPFIETKRR